MGLDEDVEGLDADRVVDVGGRTVLPGFIDAHTHLVWQGLGLAAVDIGAARSVEQALSAIGRAAESSREGWIDVRGYDQRVLGRHLVAADLDAVSNGRPVYVTHVSGHASVVNSLVLDKVPTEQLAASNPGIARDQRGNPTGLFLEMAQNIVRERRQPYALTEIMEAVQRSAASCAAQGVTFCAEAGVGAGMICHSAAEPEAYQRLTGLGNLPIRVQLMVSGDFLHVVEPAADGGGPLGMDLGLHTGFGGDRVSLGAAKFWLDGGMSARTAAVTEPYEDGSGAGSLADQIDALFSVAVAAAGGGWQLALHAIGDRAVDVALDIIEAAQRQHPRGVSRPRIEHCGLVRPDQLPRLARTGVIAVVQPEFLKRFGDDYAAIVGPRRADWLYRGRSFLAHGIPLAGSSDRPVTAGSPLAALSFMVDRRSESGAMIGGREALTLDEALAAYTRGAAYACNVEDRLGSLTPGKLADLVVLDADPFDVPAADIEHIPVAATVVSGAATFDGAGLFPG